MNHNTVEHTVRLTMMEHTSKNDEECWHAIASIVKDNPHCGKTLMLQHRHHNQHQNQHGGNIPSTCPDMARWVQTIFMGEQDISYVMRTNSTTTHFRRKLSGMHHADTNYFNKTGRATHYITVSPSPTMISYAQGYCLHMPPTYLHSSDLMIAPHTVDYYRSLIAKSAWPTSIFYISTVQSIPP